MKRIPILLTVLFLCFSISAQNNKSENQWTIELTEANTILEYLPINEILNIEKLIIKGCIGVDDIEIIHRMSSLKELDLLGITSFSFGGMAAQDSRINLTIKDMYSLKRIVLPQSIPNLDITFTWLSALEEIVFSPHTQKLRFSITHSDIKKIEFPPNTIIENLYVNECEKLGLLWMWDSKGVKQVNEDRDYPPTPSIYIKQVGEDCLIALPQGCTNSNIVSYAPLTIVIPSGLEILTCDELGSVWKPFCCKKKMYCLSSTTPKFKHQGCVIYCMQSNVKEIFMSAGDYQSELNTMSIDQLSQKIKEEREKRK